MKIYDIIPPSEKLPEKNFVVVKKEQNFDLHEKKELEIQRPVRKINIYPSNILSIFLICVLFSLLTFLFLNIDFYNLKNFLKNAFAQRELVRNFYPAKCEGTWEKPENVVGLPEVSKEGSIEFFSKENSAIYKTGPEELYCSAFKEIPKLKDNQENNTDNTNNTDICGKDYQNCKISSAKIYLSFAIDDISKIENSYTISNEKNNKPLQDKNIISAPQEKTEPFDLDTKIIIWYSTDNGQTWKSLTKITNLPLSNYLNNGYFSFNAPFINDWNQTKNLKIKIEGTLGGDEQVIVFVDSVWVEVIPKKELNGIQKIKERIFLMFTDKEEIPIKLEITKKEFDYKIPSDGKIIMRVKSLNGEIGGVFRIHIFSEENKLVGIVDIFSADFIKNKNYNSPYPRPKEIDYLLFSEVREDNSLSIDVKKKWGKVKFRVDYIPIGKEEDKDNPEENKLISENLETFFLPEPIIIDNLKLLIEDKFYTQEKIEKEINFENQKVGNFIVEIIEKESLGGGGILIYLDNKGIALIEGGYKEGRFEILRDVFPGEHKLIFKNIDSFWEDNKGERGIRIYFKEKND